MIKNTLCFGLAATGIALFGCDHDANLEQVTEPVATSVVLASFDLSNGNVVTMTGLPGLDEIMVREIAPAGEGEQFFVEEQPSSGPLELFVRLTPPGTPVPQMIFDLAGDDERAMWLGQRQVVAEAGENQFHVDIAELGWAPITTKSGGGSCNSVTGKQYFEDNHCGTMGPYGYGTTQTFCDSGAWYSLQRTSTDTMRHTYTRTAACNGTGRVRHSRDTISGWTTILDEAIPANSVATYYSYRTGIKYQRRVNFSRIDPYNDSAYVRAWTRFYEQVTANAP